MAKKFRVLYRLCEEQLSKQRHYDFGLRNILSVLRTAGKVKRDNVDKDEALLMMGTLRDMNLSKMVSQDTPLFLSLLADLFPGMEPPAGSAGGRELKDAIETTVNKNGFIMHPPWLQSLRGVLDVQPDLGRNPPGALHEDPDENGATEPRDGVLGVE